jgi:hypothetical protein
VAWPEIVARVAALRAEHAGRWAKEFEDGEAGAAELAAEALRVLAGFGLAAPSPGGFAARPAAARFSPLPAGA